MFTCGICICVRFPLYHCMLHNPLFFVCDCPAAFSAGYFYLMQMLWLANDACWDFFTGCLEKTGKWIFCNLMLIWRIKDHFNYLKAQLWVLLEEKDIQVCIVWTLWRERNLRHFEGKCNPIYKLKGFCLVVRLKFRILLALIPCWMVWPFYLKVWAIRESTLSFT